MLHMVKAHYGEPLRAMDAAGCRFLSHCQLLHNQAKLWHHKVPHTLSLTGCLGSCVCLLIDFMPCLLHACPVLSATAEAYGHHLLSTQEVRTLQAAADKALDEAGEGLRDWLQLEPSCRLRGLPRLLRAWKVRQCKVPHMPSTPPLQLARNLRCGVGRRLTTAQAGSKECCSCCRLQLLGQGCTHILLGLVWLAAACQLVKLPPPCRS